MDNTKIIVVFVLVGGIIIWELYTGKIPSKRYITKETDSPAGYWIGIVLQLVFVGFMEWRFDFNVMQRIFVQKQATSWRISVRVVYSTAI